MTRTGPSPRIVVIDDDAMVRETLLNMLRASGLDAVATAGGNDGIREVARDGADVVVTDILMPEKDGLETIRELRKVFPGVCIVAMSGGGRLGSSTYLDHAREFGADAELSKPFTIEELLDAIEACGFFIDRERRSGVC